MNIPGFTAETSCYLATTMYYQVGDSGYREMMPAVTPQLWATGPFWEERQDGGGLMTPFWEERQNGLSSVPFWGRREDGTVGNQNIIIWRDDPGGWEMNPEIGALTERQARARCIVNCNRMVNSKNRANCLESCGE